MIKNIIQYSKKIGLGLIAYGLITTNAFGEELKQFQKQLNTTTTLTYTLNPKNYLPKIIKIQDKKGIVAIDTDKDGKYDKIRINNKLTDINSMYEKINNLNFSEDEYHIVLPLLEELNRKRTLETDLFSEHIKSNVTQNLSQVESLIRTLASDDSQNDINIYEDFKKREKKAPIEEWRSWAK